MNDPRTMQELRDFMAKYFPLGDIEYDYCDQIVIYTGLRVDDAPGDPLIKHEEWMQDGR